MTKETAVENAVNYKQSGMNCAQSVLRALLEMYGIDAGEMLKASAGFAAGMGTMETTCGALIGANMVAGVKTEGQRTIMKSMEMYKLFEEACGATICKDLKGRDTGIVLCSCDNCVKNAVLAALEVLE